MKSKKTKIQIFTVYGQLLFEHESIDNSLRITVQEAVKHNINLNYANLNRADLYTINLNHANLNLANLSYADLFCTNLNFANLSYANLSHADLSYANLNLANLSYADLFCTNLDFANLSYANLSHADLSYANLSHANLCIADLSHVDLYGADLSYANLNYTDLSYVDLINTDLSHAKNLDPMWICNLYSIKMQDPNTKLKYWKYLINSKSPIQKNAITYKVGKTYEAEKYNTDENISCEEGLNVATLQWCLGETMNIDETQFIEVEFKVSDIVAVPYYSDGKFRVRKLKVLRKLSRDEALKEFKKIINGGSK